MLKLLKITLGGVFLSFFFFPFEFTFLPGVNTKMAMAGVGLVLYVLELVRGHAPLINKDGLVLVVLAAAVSLCSLLSTVVNNTNDGSYVTYIVSMFVWLGGAYMALRIIKYLHGYVSIELLCNYLIFVCVGQCVIALMINWLPTFKALVDRFVVGFDFVDTGRLTKANRIYGIGAALDVAGTRFAAVLVMIAAMLQRSYMSRYKKFIWLYIAAFIVIAVIGNMMSRTTTVGVALAVIYWAATSGIIWMYLKKNGIRIWVSLLILLSVSLPIIMHLYSVDEQFHENIRFAFEGFFSMAEKGHWETASNNALIDMVVFPDNSKTWLIGDGYILNPSTHDPYYVGPIYKGFYKGTDIGYIRFIFYFGIIGLLSFVVFFFKVAKTCRKRFPKYSAMFMLILAINMIIWFKVSTDIFLVFALFLCISKEDNDAYEKEYEDSIPDSLDV